MTNLLICDAEAGCRTVLRQEGAIDAVVEWADDCLLFVGGPWTVHENPPHAWTMSDIRSDLFATDQAGVPRKLTRWEVLGLHALTIAGSRLLFDASPRRSREGRRRSSYIYAADISEDGQVSGFDPATSEPAIEYGGRVDTKPSLSSDGTKVAFLSASSDRERKAYRYDIVVVDANTDGRLVASVRPPLGWELSWPMFVGPTAVRYLVANGSTFRFDELDTTSGEVTSIAVLPVAEVARATARTVDLPRSP